MYPKTKLKPGKPVGKKAQATLEVAFALTGVFLLLIGALQIFIWANSRFVQRQEDFEATRVEAGKRETSEELQVNESNYPKLDIFNEGR